MKTNLEVIKNKEIAINEVRNKRWFCTHFKIDRLIFRKLEYIIHLKILQHHLMFYKI
jgi:hypothetical protein